MVKALMALSDFFVAHQFFAVGIVSALSAGKPHFDDEFPVLGVQVAGPQSSVTNQRVFVKRDHECQGGSPVWGAGNGRPDRAPWQDWK
jgi:hypothetical protein